MAYLNISGAETGDLSEVYSSSGSVAASTVVKRTGSYSYRINPSGAAAYIVLTGLNAAGVPAGLGASISYTTFYLYFTTLPAANSMVAAIGETATGNNIAELWVDSSGQLTLVGTTTSAVITTFSTGTQYRIEFKAQNANTCGCKVNGGSETTVTGKSPFSNNYLRFGSTSAITMDMYVDDIAISDSAYPGAGQVNILKPNATGTYSDWTNGAGTSPTNVAEVPHTSDTGYIVAGTVNDHASVNLDSSTTAGVAGTIATVKHVNILRTPTAADVRIILKSGAQENASNYASLTTSYAAYAKMYDLDPIAGSPSWTTTNLDAIEGGPQTNTTGADTARCTAIYAMVWCTGASAVKAFKRTLLGVGV